MTSSSIVGWRLPALRLVGAAAVADRQRAQRHALVDAHAVADQRGLADDDAGAVVDEERLADGRAGVDVDAGARVGVLGQHARHHLGAVAQQPVRDAVDRDGVQARVAGDDLVDAGRRRVGLERRQHVLAQQRADLRQRVQQAARDGARALAALVEPAPSWRSGGAGPGRRPPRAGSPATRSWPRRGLRRSPPSVPMRCDSGNSTSSSSSTSRRMSRRDGSGPSDARPGVMPRGRRSTRSARSHVRGAGRRAALGGHLPEEVTLPWPAPPAWS